MMFLFELGVFLMILPWFGLWEANYFLNHYPVLRPYLMHPSVRGAISGLGALDILIATMMLRRRPESSTSPSA